MREKRLDRRLIITRRSSSSDAQKRQWVVLEMQEGKDETPNACWTIVDFCLTQGPASSEKEWRGWKTKELLRRSKGNRAVRRTRGGIKRPRRGS